MVEVIGSGMANTLAYYELITTAVKSFIVQATGAYLSGAHLRSIQDYTLIPPKTR